tara:strand:+ start:741 stop:1067 length:327 start_codon:yes stop_codon:yes gene_type:complete
MTPKQLRKRQVFVKASPIKKIGSLKSFSRRDVNKIKETKEAHPNDVFDTFFDFEEDISSMKPSSEQFIFEENRDNERTNSDKGNYTDKGYTIMSEISLDRAVVMSPKK